MEFCLLLRCPFCFSGWYVLVDLFFCYVLFSLWLRNAQFYFYSAGFLSNFSLVLDLVYGASCPNFWCASCKVFFCPVVRMLYLYCSSLPSAIILSNVPGLLFCIFCSKCSTSSFCSLVHCCLELCIVFVYWSPAVAKSGRCLVLTYKRRSFLCFAYPRGLFEEP